MILQMAKIMDAAAIDSSDEESVYERQEEVPEPSNPEEFLNPCSIEKSPREINPFKDKILRLPDLLKKESQEEWIFDGLFCRGDLVVLFGTAKSGKTFLALDMIVCAAAGKAWCDGKFKAPSPRTVVYCAGEGLRGLRHRWKSIMETCISNGTDESVCSRIITVSIVPQLFIDPMTPGGVEQFISEIRKACKEETIDLVVIDTLHRASRGANENSSQDFGTILSAIERIQNELGAAVMLIHHSDKSADEKARGSSALLGAVDVCLKTKKGVDGNKLLCDCMKDGAEFDPINFSLHPIGESCIVTWTKEEPKEKRTSAKERVLSYLGKYPDNWHTAAEITKHGGVTRSSLVEILKRLEQNRKIESRLSDMAKKASNRNPWLYKALKES